MLCKRLNAHTAKGPDNISTRLLKCCHLELSEVFCYMFNKSPGPSILWNRGRNSAPIPSEKLFQNHAKFPLEAPKKSPFPQFLFSIFFFFYEEKSHKKSCLRGRHRSSPSTESPHNIGSRVITLLWSWVRAPYRKFTVEPADMSSLGVAICFNMEAHWLFWLHRDHSFSG